MIFYKLVLIYQIQNYCDRGDYIQTNDFIRKAGFFGENCIFLQKIQIFVRTLFVASISTF